MDINKQIEEEAREYRRKLIQKIRLNKANIDYILENGTINGSLMLDIDKAMINYHEYASHWRKVSEELPPIDTQVLVKTSNGKFSISTMYVPRDCNGNILGDIEWKGSFSFKCSIIEWKPID